MPGRRFLLALQGSGTCCLTTPGPAGHPAAAGWCVFKLQTRVSHLLQCRWATVLCIAVPAVDSPQEHKEWAEAVLDTPGLPVVPVFSANIHEVRVGRRKRGGGGRWGGGSTSLVMVL